MECMVCRATWPDNAGGLCPQCGWDPASPRSRDQHTILAAREAFRAQATAYAPDTRVTRRDKLVPWLGLGLGVVILLVVLASCRILY